MARGGRRQGTPGTAYPQRTDLQMPATAPTGLPYGEHQQLVDDQRKVPVATPPAPAPQMPAAQPQGQPFSPPGAQPFLRPTERPTEPVTAGLPVGPGPGPEVLGPTQTVSVGDVLHQAAQQSGSNALAQLAGAAQRLGQ